jgi:hypothetical protein
MRSLTGLTVAVLGLLAAGPVAAQQPTIEDLMKKIDALQHRVDELEHGQHGSTASAPPARRTATAAAPAKSQVAAAPSPLPAPAAAPQPPVTEAKAAPSASPFANTVPGLQPPEPMGNSWEDALRSDLPGIAIRVPGTDTQVRLYGWAKLSAYQDLNARNQTDTPPVQTIPLANSAQAMQGGDFGMTARFSRFGMDTRTLTSWGTLETRLEGDFGGGTATGGNNTFRLRQAWGELGDEKFRVLIGQANSLWNEGVFETLIDATNLNQSFIRQAQVRVTGRLAPGLTGMASLEAPNTQYTSVVGVFSPDSSFTGSPSPAFDAAPDLLGRLTYRDDGLVLDLRALLRLLSVRTSGTMAAPPAQTNEAAGWGLAPMVRFPMRWLSDAFGADELVGMAYYGEGIGRYFAGNTSGQDLLTNLGQQGTTNGYRIDPLQTYGATVAYRRFWTPQLRSNFSFAYARNNYPSYALGFAPGSSSAVFLNRDMQQAFVNLIWSPFGDIRDGTFGAGWLDVGLEYLYSRRDLFGGSPAAGSAGTGLGVANRIVAAVTARF